MEPEIRFFNSAHDGTRIAYAAFGNGPVLVQVPRWAHCIEWMSKEPEIGEFYEKLSQKYRVIILERRGTGAAQRDVTDFSMAAHVGDLRSLIEHLKLERVNLFGAGDSGAVCIAYACERPADVANLVLWTVYADPLTTREMPKPKEGDTPGLDLSNPRNLSLWVDMMRANWPGQARLISDVVFPGGPLDLQRRAAALWVEWMAPDVAIAYYGFAASIDIRHLLPDVRSRTLVLHRRDDRGGHSINSSKAVAAKIPGAVFRAIDEGSALIAEVEHDQVLAAIEAFLDDGGSPETTENRTPIATAGTMNPILDRSALMENFSDAMNRSSADAWRSISFTGRSPEFRTVTSADGEQVTYAILGQGPPIVYVPPWGIGNPELDLAHPAGAAFFGKLARQHTLALVARRSLVTPADAEIGLSLETQLGDLQAVIDDLGAEAVDIWALDDGCAIAARFAAVCPERVRHLVLWGAYARTNGANDPAVQALVRMARADWPLARRSFAELNFPSGPEDLRSWFADYHERSFSPEGTARFLEFAADIDVRGDLAGVRVPTLVLHRRGDCVIAQRAAQSATSLIPGASLRLLDGDIHVPYFGDTSYVNAVEAFLDDQTPLPTGTSAEEPTAGPSVAAAGGTNPAPSPGTASPVRFCTTEDGARIAYSSEGTGLPYVWIPGLTHIGHLIGGVPSAPTYLVQRWSRLTRVVLYDARGFGLSVAQPPDLNLEARLRDLDAVVSTIDAGPVVLRGMADGAGVAIAYAATRPASVRALILIAPFASGSALAALWPQGIGEVLGGLLRAHPTLGTQTIQAAISGQSTSDDDAAAISADTLHLMLEASNALEVTPYVASVTAPTLVVHGTKDSVIPVEVGRALAAALPNAQLFEYDGPHTPPNQQIVDSVTAAITDFLGIGASEKDAGKTQTFVAAPKLDRTFASGRYVVRRVLGQGGQKIVYLVHDTALDRECALALVKTDVVEPDDAARIRREAQAMARLGAHSNIVSVHDIGDDDGNPYLVCEYVPAGELRRYLQDADAPVPFERALSIASDIARALAVAHGRGIVHRDVKPANVWLCDDGSAKLGDFGIALSASHSRMTMPGTVMGTADYLSPEQALAEPATDRSDLYSLGCVLYEMVCGRPPFASENVTAVIAQHIHATPALPSTYRPDVPHALEDLISRLLAKLPAQRPASAAAVLAELQRVADGHADDAESQPSLGDHPVIDADAGTMLHTSAEAPPSGAERD